MFSVNRCQKASIFNVNSGAIDMPIPLAGLTPIFFSFPTINNVGLPVETTQMAQWHNFLSTQFDTCGLLMFFDFEIFHGVVSF